MIINLEHRVPTKMWSLQEFSLGVRKGGEKIWIGICSGGAITS